MMIELVGLVELVELKELVALVEAKPNRLSYLICRRYLEAMDQTST
jgi:hypothetical protein